MIKVYEGSINSYSSFFWTDSGLSQAGGWGAPVFDRSVNPISTRGAHYPHPVLQAPRIFRPCDGPVTRLTL